MAYLKSGNEKFIFMGSETGQNVSGFWSWAYSDLLGNSIRGILAEYIVRSALGITSGRRHEWDAYDFETEKGVKIKVKSPSQPHRWGKKLKSGIQFDIKHTRGLDNKTKEYSRDERIISDIYIFCALINIPPQKVDPLNLDQWDFYIISAAELNEKREEQQSISLKSLMKLGPLHVKYNEISDAVDNLSGI